MALDSGDGVNQSQQPHFDTLETEMSNLNNRLPNGGLEPGSVVCIRSDPSSFGDHITAQFASERPTWYYSLGKDNQKIQDIYNDVDIDTSRLYIEQVEADNKISKIRADLNKNELNQGSSVVVNPANQLQSVDINEFKQLVTSLKDIIRDCDGLVIFHVVKDEPGEENEWFTKYFCDYLFDLSQQESENRIAQKLSIRKLNSPEKGKNERVFEISVSEHGLDISSTRSVSA